MGEHRIPCPKCGTPILEVTAKYNEGICAPCCSDRRQSLRVEAEAEARRNAPPSPINYRSFTKEEFIHGLKKVCLPLQDDPSKLPTEFLGFCDPITYRPSTITILTMLFPNRLHHWGLMRIPRPYRECLAVYQAWGMVGDDGFESYLSQTNKKFDAEVELGLETLRQSTPKGVIGEARNVYLAHNEDIPEAIEAELWNRFYDPLANLQTILGKWLIAELFGTTNDR